VFVTGDDRKAPVRPEIGRLDAVVVVRTAGGMATAAYLERA
jgi:hypothetical protein